MADTGGTAPGSSESESTGMGCNGHCAGGEVGESVSFAYQIQGKNRSVRIAVVMKINGVNYRQQKKRFRVENELSFSVNSKSIVIFIYYRNVLTWVIYRDVIN
jgi:hypothetical protein